MGQQDVPFGENCGPTSVVPGPDEVWSIVLSFLKSRTGRILTPIAVVGAVAGAVVVVNSTGNVDTALVSAGSQNLSLANPIASASPLVSTTPQALPSASPSADASPSVEASSTPSRTATRAVVTSVVVKTESLPFSTVRHNTSTLPLGTTKVVTPGVKGVAKVTYKITKTNGRITDRTKVSVDVVTKPVTKVVQVGTNKTTVPKSTTVKPTTPTTSTKTGTKADSLNWAALAKCESGGNPRAVNPSGRYFGLYQFSLTTWRSVGGTGNPIDASPAEQTKRAKILYNKAGAGQWPVCGRKLFT